MKQRMRFVENLLLTLLLIGAMLGIYLYAGQQESASDTPVSTEAPAAALAMPEISNDGRLRDAVLSVFSDAGYELSEQASDHILLSDTDGMTCTELILSQQGDRVNGLTLRIPLPTKPQTQKKPTKIEQALLERYEEQLKKLRSTLPLLLQASLSAVDPYGEVPSTARLYWEDLLLDALEGDRNASDSGQAIRMRLYESETEDGTHLCLSLQMK